MEPYFKALFPFREKSFFLVREIFTFIYKCLIPLKYIFSEKLYDTFY